MFQYFVLYRKGNVPSLHVFFPVVHGSHNNAQFSYYAANAITFICFTFDLTTRKEHKPNLQITPNYKIYYLCV